MVNVAKTSNDLISSFLFIFSRLALTGVIAPFKPSFTQNGQSRAGGGSVFITGVLKVSIFSQQDLVHFLLFHSACPHAESPV